MKKSDKKINPSGLMLKGLAEVGRYSIISWPVHGMKLENIHRLV